MLKGEERKGCIEALAMYETLSDAEKEKVPEDFIEYLKKHGSGKDRSDEVDINVNPISTYGWTLIAKIAGYITK